MSTTTQELHREMFDCVQQRDIGRLRSLFHDDYVYSGPDGVEHKGADAAVEIAEMYLAAFPDLRFEVLHQHELGYASIIELVAHGTHRGELQGIAPTGRHADVPVCNVIEVKDGRILREREYFDTAVMLTQLGVMDPM
ncbi:MAG: ester cyclase [Actinomycetes bacterium]